MAETVDEKLAKLNEDELLEKVKDPAVREFLRRKQGKLGRAARSPAADPRNEDPRYTRLG